MLQVILSWRVKEAGRHLPERATWGKAVVHDVARCLDDARSLWATEGVSQLFLVLHDGSSKSAPLAWWWAPGASWVKR